MESFANPVQSATGNQVMIVEDRPMLFGTELRRRRLEAGLSLTDMAKIVHYSKSHLSKMENGVKSPTAEFARRCDAALRCDGQLSQRASRPAAAAAATEQNEANEVWMLTMDSTGETGFGTVSRRTALVGGVFGQVGGMVLGRPPVEPSAKQARDSAGLTGFRVLFDQVRGLGQQVGPEALLPVLVGGTHAVRSLGQHLGGGARKEAFRLAARFAEYTGWIAQEGGHDREAVWWTDRAVEFAAVSGDDGMAAYALVRRALIAMYRQDAAQTIALAETAQRARVRPRIRGLAAQRAAQGYALAGDRTACFRALEQAREFLAADPGDDEPTIGTTHVVDPVAMSAGWVLYDLGSPGDAADVLGVELDRLPRGAYRARARYGARRTLALASSGQIEQACSVGDQVLDAYLRVRSATVRSDLRDLLRTLRRWHSHASAREFSLHLTDALHTPARG
ncbi:helix-turn-helix transcriptional regulator [Pilimelia terevasa]|nr:helix-turn-helix transcriptional regulator [Pilimelia terevasa]